jgi:RecJ-like exonuclease
MAAKVAAKESNTGNETMCGTIEVGCGKCEATGTIRSFQHVADGVCFACGGSGKLTVSREAVQQQAADRAVAAAETARKRSWVLAATPSKLASLPFKKLHSVFHFVAICSATGDSDIAAVEPMVRRVFEKALSN